MAARQNATRGRLRSLLPSGLWLWLTPLGVVLVVRTVPSRLADLVALLIGLAVALLAARAPGRTLLVLVALLPFHHIAIPLLYRLGAPAEVAYQLGGWNEKVLAGVALAAAVHFTRRPYRLDRLDQVGVLFVALCTVYLLVPGIAVSPEATSQVPIADWPARLAAYRVNVGFVFAFLVARHAPIAPAFGRQLGRVLLWLGAIIGAATLLETAFPAAWRAFLLQWVQIPKFQLEVLHVATFGSLRATSLVGDGEVVRAGSVLLAYVSMACMLLLPYGVGLAALSRRLARPAVLVVVGISAASVVLSVTRSAILGLLVVAFVVVRARPQSGPGTARLRLVLLLACAAVGAASVLATTTVAQRAGEAFDPKADDTEVHLVRLELGLSTLLEAPLGLGLGSNPGTAHAYETRNQVVAENAYLQVGNEVGIPGMALFIALLLLVIRHLRLAERRDRSPTTAGVRAAFVAMAVVGMFLHIWIDFLVAWVFWLAAGACIGISDRAVRASDAARSSHSRRRPAMK